MIDFPPRPDEDDINFRINIVLSRFEYNFENFGERKKNHMLSGSFLQRGMTCTWNDIDGCHMNQKQSEMTFRALANMHLMLLIFTVSNI